jgi:anti-anti-sigma regulatory factor
VREKLLEGHRKFLFDCAGIEYWNRRGLELIIMATVPIKEQGGFWRLCSLHPKTSIIFQSSGLSFLNIVGSCGDAMNTSWQEP